MCAIWRRMTVARIPLSHFARAQIGGWLLIVAAFVGAMTVIGGITRLTESGLSMAEWRPLIGWIPPHNEIEWARVFALYQATPEYRQINAGMSLAEFQSIFWWEYIHRVWGRLIGIVYAAPLAYFWLKGWIVGPLRGRLLLLLALGGLQGVIGWWMVKSGLVNRPDVSHYRLAVHLGMAFLIAGLLVWTALDLIARPMKRAAHGLRRHGQWALAAVSLVVVLGAFVAGTNAGLIYNEFPYMGGRLIPADLMALSPWWHNPLENLTTIQFQHRWAAMATAVMIFWLWFEAWDRAPERGQRIAVSWFAAAALAQIALGVATLIAAVWIPLAALHQAMALLLFLGAVWTVWSFQGAGEAQTP